MRILVALTTVTLVLGLAGCRPRAVAPEILPPDLPRVRPVAPLFEPGLAPEMLEGPERDAWQKPAEIVATLKLGPGSRVADLGAGSGYLVPHLSRAVGPEGVVFAEEIQEAFLPSLEERARKLGNVRVVLGRFDDPLLPEGRIDTFVLLTVYHEVDEPVAFLRTLLRYAAPGARLAIIDFDASRKGEPPAPPGHQVWEEDVRREAPAAGWELETAHDLLHGSSQFFLVFRASRRSNP